MAPADSHTRPSLRLDLNRPSLAQISSLEAEKAQHIARFTEHWFQANYIQLQIDARVPSLPDDVIYLIIEYSKPSPMFDAGIDVDEERTRLHTLASLCQMSTRWLNPARKYHYHDLAGGLCWEKLCGTLHLEPNITALVRRVVVSRWALPGWRVGEDLHLLPNLIEVCIVEASLEDLTLSSVPNLERLVCVYPSRTCFWLEKTSCWPKLEFLCLSLEIPDDISMPVASLRTLEFDHLSMSFSQLQFVAPENPRALRLRALTSLEIVGCSQDAFDDSLATASVLVTAPNFELLRFYDNKFQLSDPSQLPGILTEVDIEWRTCDPSHALSFVQKRQGVLRWLTLSGVDVADNEWESVGQAAYEFGVQFKVNDL